MIERIYTIGGYGFTPKAFFRELGDAHIDVFCDIRQRRGMRGQVFSFLNSQRLQQRLGEIHIPYVHLRAFAPTSSIRQRQKEEDENRGIGKRSREALGRAFIDAYCSEILANKKPDDLLLRLPENVSRPCLFCVERHPEACHRSLMAEWIAKSVSIPVIHLSPSQCPS